MNVSLPAEVLYHIFSYVRPIDLPKLDLVCKNWFEVARDNSLNQELRKKWLNKKELKFFKDHLKSKECPIISKKKSYIEEAYSYISSLFFQELDKEVPLQRQLLIYYFALSVIKKSLKYRFDEPKFAFRVSEVVANRISRNQDRQPILPLTQRLDIRFENPLDAIKQISTNVNQQDGLDLLNTSIRFNFKKRVIDLIHLGINLKKFTGLRELVLSDSCEMTLLLLENGVNPNHKEPRQGNSLLHEVAASGLAQMAKILCTHGADVNAVNSLGFSPLDVAAKSCAMHPSDGKRKCIQILQQHGAIKLKPDLPPTSLLRLAKNS